MASHRHFPKMGGIHFPYWLPGRNPVQLEIIRFKAGFFLLFCCDESDAFLSNYNTSRLVQQNVERMTRANLEQTKVSLDVWLDSYEDILIIYTFYVFYNSMYYSIFVFIMT